MNSSKLSSEVIARIRNLPKEKQEQYLAFLQQKGLSTHDIELTAPAEDVQASNRPLRTRASPLQEQLWSIDQIQGGSSEYNIYLRFSLRGSLNSALLSSAFEALIEAQPVLRTTYLFADKILWQVIEENYSLPMEEVDLSSLAPAEREQHFRSLTAEVSNTHFDFGRDLPLKILLVKFDEKNWQLCLVIHHIAVDEESFSILLRQLNSVYTSLSKCDKPSIETFSSDYRDFSARQCEHITSDDGKKALEFWRQRLEGIPLLHSLPTRGIRPPAFSHQNASITSNINSDLLAQITEKSRVLNISVFSFFMAIFSSLVSVYSRDNKTSIGSPVTLRRSDDDSNVIGNFTDTRLYYTDFSELNSLAQVFDYVRHYTQMSVRHQIPFSTIASMINPQRSSSFNPLFQVMMVFTGPEPGISGMPGFDLPGLEVCTQDLPTNLSRYDLALNISQSDAGLHLRWDYETSIFDPLTIAAFSRCFEYLVQHSILEPNRPLREIKRDWSLREIKQVFPDAGKPESIEQAPAADSEVSIRELILHQAKLRPNDTALSQDGFTLSYSELEQRSAFVARHLCSVGVQSKQLVGIFFTNSIDAIVAMLAVLRMGSAYVPLDKSYPQERIRYIITDAGISTVLTSSCDVASLKALCDTMEKRCQNPVLAEGETRGQTMTLVAIDELFQHYEDKAYADHDITLDPVPEEADLAYVIYTSGSTGKPQGVRITHGNLLASTQARYAYYERPVTRFLLVSSIAFDSSVAGIYWTLSTGGELVLSEDIRKSGLDQLYQLICKRKVTHVLCLPSLYRYFLDTLDNSNPLQIVIVAGEPCSTELVKKHNTSVFTANTRLFNEYGPTESTVWSTVFEVPRSFNSPIVPIGRAVQHISATVLDDNGNYLPVGAVGELCLSGPGIAHGYLNQRNEEQNKFFENPAAHEKFERFYRTGDIVRLGFDGNYEYIERNDRQVKIRGFRVDLNEIENTIQALEYLSAAAVVCKNAKGDNASVVAFYVCPQENEGIEDAICGYLKNNLPEYMRPNVIIPIDSLPQTPNGKVDYPHLEKQCQTPTNIDSDEEEQGELSPLEQEICGYFCEILGVASCRANDSFFSLGGNSLSLVALIHKINREFSIEINIESVVQSPSPRSIAFLIQSTAKTVSSGAANTGTSQASIASPMKIEKGRHTDLDESAVSLSFSQLRLWSLSKLYPGNIFYNVPLQLSLTGQVDIAQLKFSVEAIVSRHEILRTVYQEQEGVPYQKIIDSCDVPFEYIDLNTDSSTLAVLLKEHSEIPFDLRIDIPLRVFIYKVRTSESESETYKLLLLFHHIASDAWSMDIFVKEVMETYSHRVCGTELNLEAPEFQYADYALWQKGFLQSEPVLADIQFWQKQLEGLPAVHQFPLDRRRPAQQRYRGDTLYKTMSEPGYSSLFKVAQTHGLSLFSLLISCYGALLSRWGCGSDVVIGTPAANRSQVESASIIGFFVNTLVLRMKVNPDDSFKSFLMQVKDLLSKSFSRQHIPVEVIMDALGTKRDTSYNPLFQLMFSFDSDSTYVSADKMGSAFTLPGIEITSESSHTSVAKFDLSLNLHTDGDKIVSAWQYNTDIFDRETIVQLSLSYERLLQAVVGDINTRISLLSIVSESQLAQLSTWSYPPASHIAVNDHAVYVHELFQAQVNHNPNCVALTNNKAITISFEDLNTRANQMAHYLLARGFEAQQRVAIMYHKSIEAIVSILAVLKLGGIYIPIDPNYPEERISICLKQSKPHWLISSTTLLLDHIASVKTSDRTIALDDAEFIDVVNRCDRDNIPESRVPLTPSSLAYILYTSGSTGTPKGVAVSHYALTRHLKTVSQIYGFDECKNFLLFSSLSFDPSIQQLFIPLIKGKTNYIFDPYSEDLINVVRKQKIDALHLTPSYFSQYLDRIDEFKKHIQLKWLNFGAEKLSPGIISACQTANICKRIANTYGPTECVIATHLYSKLESFDTYDGRRNPPIGKVMGDRKQYILDEYGQQVPPGAVGELYISSQNGAGLASGYFLDDEKTKDRFSPDQFSNTAEIKYKTGDIVRYTRDGNVLYLGRKDRQVKVNGYRIECEEVEHCIRQYDQVADTAVVLVQGKLVAYVIFFADESGDPGEKNSTVNALKHFVSKRLPSFACPSAFVSLDKLPVNTHGKLDTSRLPEPCYDNSNSKKYIAPSSELEVKLYEVWSELLNVERIGVDDNFFDLGGHSLLANRLAAKINNIWQVECSVTTIFACQTIAEQTSYIEKEKQLNRVIGVDPQPEIDSPDSEEEIWEL